MIAQWTADVLTLAHRPGPDPAIPQGSQIIARQRVRDPVPPALKRFIWDIQSVIELAESEREILVVGRDLMARLVADDRWLATPFANSANQSWQQFLLYTDASERFTVTSTVLARGQALPIWPQPVWEITGVLRGAIGRRRFAPPDAGSMQLKADKVLNLGETGDFSATSRDATQIYNADANRESISIHVYGGDVSKPPRDAIAPGGLVQELVHGYANPEDWPPYDIYSIQTVIRD
jgi:3-mercaptopropionate dioxygenase